MRVTLLLDPMQTVAIKIAAMSAIQQVLYGVFLLMMLGILLMVLSTKIKK